ncbi:unknown protein [Seminavis robusta]|uniref:Uncharacterized protein n=1 Tax=Seminavis robusta TaxID=568900 RepID=A0A9N8F606_9STRA|nr:unknown protein [Seminavis robusta]|eukprot:Sro3848_g351442.1  (105) ;mRNA; r:2015-2329
MPLSLALHFLIQGGASRSVRTGSRINLPGPRRTLAECMEEKRRPCWARFRDQLCSCVPVGTRRAKVKPPASSDSIEVVRLLRVACTGTRSDPGKGKTQNAEARL